MQMDNMPELFTIIKPGDIVETDKHDQPAAITRTGALWCGACDKPSQAFSTTNHLQNAKKHFQMAPVVTSHAA